MSVVGIDLGAQSTKIGVARNKGIDIVRNPATLMLNRDLFFFFLDYHDYAMIDQFTDFFLFWGYLDHK